EALATTQHLLVKAKDVTQLKRFNEVMPSGVSTQRAGEPTGVLAPSTGFARQLHTLWSCPASHVLPLRHESVRGRVSLDLEEGRRQVGTGSTHNLDATATRVTG